MAIARDAPAIDCSIRNGIMFIGTLPPKKKVLLDNSLQIGKNGKS
jgi:hypothetical protein